MPGRLRFLGTLGSIQPASETPWPFVNRPEPMSFAQVCSRSDLMFGDIGSVYLFLDGDRVHGVMQCY